MNAGPAWPMPAAAGGLPSRPDPAAVAGTALWAFIGVAGTLFTLFVAAYVMRMDGSDWAAFGLPRLLWLSSALLVAGSVALALAARSARDGDLQAARQRLHGGAIAALAFLLAQAAAWVQLLDAQVGWAGNPAASFFYLLTALHALHVVGGLAGWSIAVAALRAPADPQQAAWRIALAARYWHFLLAAWLLLFATFAGLTPELVRFVCGTA